MNINQLELAGELASLKLTNYANFLNKEEYQNEFPQGLIIDIDGDRIYTEEAQDLFNIYYDEYWDIIENCKE